MPGEHATDEGNEIVEDTVKKNVLEGIRKVVKAFDLVADRWVELHPHAPRLDKVALHFDRSSFAFELKSSHHGMIGDLEEEVKDRIATMREKVASVVALLPDSALPVTLVLDVERYVRPGNVGYHDSDPVTLELAGIGGNFSFAHGMKTLERRLDAFERIDSLCDMDPDENANRSWVVIQEHLPTIALGETGIPSALNRQTVGSTSYVMARTEMEANLKAALVHLGAMRFNSAFDAREFSLDRKVTVHDVSHGDTMPYLFHCAPIHFAEMDEAKSFANVSP